MRLHCIILYFSEYFYIFTMKSLKNSIIKLKNMHREKTERNYNKNFVNSCVRMMDDPHPPTPCFLL